MREDVGKLWNEFVETLMKSQELWQRYQKELFYLKGKEETFPLAVQKVTRFFKGTTFSVGLPRLLEFVRSHGGLTELLITLPKEEKKLGGNKDGNKG